MINNYNKSAVSHNSNSVGVSLGTSIFLTFLPFLGHIICESSICKKKNKILTTSQPREREKVAQKKKEEVKMDETTHSAEEGMAEKNTKIDKSDT